MSPARSIVSGMLRRLLILTVLLAAAAGLRADESAAYQQALALYKAHQYPDAREAFTALAAAEPQNAKARYFLGRIALKRNDADDAVAQLEQAVALDAGNSDYWAELGGAYGTAAKHASLLAQLSLAKKCRAALEKAVALNPDNLDARRGLVTYYRQAPGFLGGGVTKAYDEAAEIRKRDFPNGTLILGFLYTEDHRYDEAIDLYRELLRQQPDHYLAHYAIGRIAAETGHDAADGNAHLERCLALKPAPDEPSHAAVHWRLGQIKQRTGDRAAAQAEFEQSLQLDANFRQAAEALAKLKATPAA